METEQTKKQKKISGKAKLNASQRRNLYSAILMSFACILMLSGATYAWFTLGNTAKVLSMSLQVASEGKLYIADTQAGLAAKKNELDLNMTSAQVLYPCTSADGKLMKKPVYESDTLVSKTEDIPAAEKKNYYYEKEIWLEVEETLGQNMSSNTYDITLSKKMDNDGSYINAQNASSHPEYSIRISFETPDGKVAVYEPNYDGHLGGTQGVDYAQNSVSAFTETHKQGTDGLFKLVTGTTYYAGDSGPLFSVQGNVATKVIVRVWFEGTDHDCQNSIQAEKLAGQFKFVSHKQESGN